MIDPVKQQDHQPSQLSSFEQSACYSFGQESQQHFAQTPTNSIVLVCIHFCRAPSLYLSLELRFRDSLSSTLEKKCSLGMQEKGRSAD